MLTLINIHDGDGIGCFFLAEAPLDQERGLKDCPALDLRRARRPALRWRREWPQRGHCHQRVRRSVCQRTPFLPVRPSPLSPNSEEGNEIEKTRRAPSAVGRVTPCAPRLQPARAKFPWRPLPDPLSIKIFLEFAVPTSEFGLSRAGSPAGRASGPFHPFHPANSANSANPANPANAGKIPAGFPRRVAVCSAPMFDLVKPQIATAADKLTHLRRFL